MEKNLKAENKDQHAYIKRAWAKKTHRFLHSNYSSRDIINTLRAPSSIRPHRPGSHDQRRRPPYPTKRCMRES